jgi:hypothetical protein
MAEAGQFLAVEGSLYGHLEQTEGHLRLLEEIFPTSSPIAENSERVHASMFDIDENALVVMGAGFLTRVILHRPLACKGSSVYAHFLRI